MYIEADVCFELVGTQGAQKDQAAQTEFERRVLKYTDNFEQWRGDYQVFDNQDLKVEVMINRVYSGTNAARVLIGDGDIIRAFAWGGKNIFGWDAKGGKTMGLPTDYTNSAVAIHEFGHWLGLQDAYAISNDWMPIEALRFPLHGVRVGVYPDYDEHTIMNITGTHDITKQEPRITNNDIEMVVLAFKTGQRQNYQIQFPWEKISDAMGQGN